jgi:uncharacterized protein YggT (Ycf19 family)
MASDLIQEHTVDHDRRDNAVAIVARVINLAFSLLYTLLIIRLALVFFGASQGAGFFQMIRSATDPFYLPFRGLFASSLISGHPLEWSLVVAMLAYALLHGIIRGLLRLLVRA